MMKAIDSKIILNGEPFEHFEIDFPMGEIDFRGVRSIKGSPTITIFSDKDMLIPSLFCWFHEKDMSKYIINDVLTVIINAKCSD